MGTSGVYSFGSQFNNYMYQNFANVTSVFQTCAFSSNVLFAEYPNSYPKQFLPVITTSNSPNFNSSLYNSEIEIEQYTGLTINYESSF